LCYGPRRKRKEKKRKEKLIPDHQEMKRWIEERENKETNIKYRFT